MVDLIHEILNDHLVVVPEDNYTIKVIRQESLSTIAKEIDEAIEKENKK